MESRRLKIVCKEEERETKQDVQYVFETCRSRNAMSSAEGIYRLQIGLISQGIGWDGIGRYSSCVCFASGPGSVFLATAVRPGSALFPGGEIGRGAEVLQAHSILSNDGSRVRYCSMQSRMC